MRERSALSFIPYPVYQELSPTSPAHQPCPVYQILTFLAQDTLVKGVSLWRRSVCGGFSQYIVLGFLELQAEEAGMLL